MDTAMARRRLREAAVVRPRRAAVRRRDLRVRWRQRRTIQIASGVIQASVSQWGLNSI